MKIRNGFISNSSSSSFIVQLTKPIEQYTLEEFMKEYEIASYKANYAQTLFKDLHEQDFEIHDYDIGIELYSDKISGILSEEQLDSIRQKTKTYFKKLIKKNINELENTYIVEYSDEGGGFWSDMEHDFMPGLSCTIKRISHH